MVSRISAARERVAAAVKIAAEHADEVDREARIPTEAIAALKEAKLFSAALPVEAGGGGMSVEELIAITRDLSAADGSLGMIYAMHAGQALIYTRHVMGTAAEQLVRDAATHEWVIASATTEITTGGDLRRSTCCVEDLGDGRIHLQKNAPVISYAEIADIVNVTARRGADAPESDQVLVACPIGDVTLTPTIPWDVMGFRGTRSDGFIIDTTTAASAVLEAPYLTISQETVLPTTHLLWTSVWLGLADAAVEKARIEVRKAAVKSPGVTPPQAARLTDLLVEHQKLEATHSDALARFEAWDATGEEPTVAFTLAMSNLKRICASGVAEVALMALSICGLNGYRDDHPASMSRLIRDSLGPELMISNQRIRSNTAEMALAYRR